MADTVNPQIVDAVQQSKNFVIDTPDNLPTKLVKSQVAHAVGLAITDASDYVRNVTTLSSTVTGVALRKMLEDVASVPQATAALEAAMQAVTSATKNLEDVGKSAKVVLDAWPKE